jgi:uncharacterized protein (TIGR03083 family)
VPVFPLPMTDVDHSIATLRASHERLRALVEPLSPEEIRQTSFCSDWSIAQVLSHLGSQAELLGGFLTAALAGEPEPDRESFPAVWDRWNARSPEEQRAEGLAANEQAVVDIESVDEPVRSELQISMFSGFLTVDVPGFARLRLMEHAIHSWDIAVTLDPDAVIDPAAVALIVDELPALVGRFAQPHDGLRLRIDVSDPTSSWLLAPGEEGFEPYVDQPVDGTLAVSAEQLIRLVYGRLRPADDLTVDAPGITVADLEQVFPGP